MGLVYLTTKEFNELVEEVSLYRSLFSFYDGRGYGDEIGLRIKAETVSQKKLLEKIFREEVAEYAPEIKQENISKEYDIYGALPIYSRDFIGDVSEDK